MEFRDVVRRRRMIRKYDDRPGDPAMLVADSLLAREELGWEPIYSDLDTIIAHA